METPTYGKSGEVSIFVLPNTKPAEKIMATDEKTRTELEAAVYRRLVEHLRGRTDVQNIDLMNLAGFCRNCLSNWMKDAADAKGLPMTRKKAARSSTACRTTNGAPSTRRKPRPSRRPHSKKQAKSTDPSRLRPWSCAVLWMSARAT